MEELWLMINRIYPLNWGWVKFAFVSLGILSFLGFKLNHKIIVHSALEILAFLGLCYIFAHGIVSRGILGTSVSHYHEWYYYLILIPHVVCGLIYIIIALFLFILGFMIIIKKNGQYLMQHRRLGYLGFFLLIVSILLSLPL